MATTSQVAEMTVELEALGYRPGTPRLMGVPAVEIDREVCSEAECEQCGHVGLEYRPFTRPPRGYRVLAVCPECGTATEF